MVGIARFLVLTTAVAILLPHSAAALAPRPDRKLTQDDAIALSVHRADRIVVGRVPTEHDTTVSRGEHSGPATFHKARFSPERWLKGPRARGDFAFCLLPGDRAGGQEIVGTRGVELPGPRGTFILFVHRPDFPGAPAITYGGALQRSCTWVSIQTSDPYHVPGLYRWTDKEEAAVRRAVARQSIDALIRRADRIVLGRVLPPSNARPAPGSAYAQAPRTIAATRTLKATHRARVDVQPVVPFWSPGGSRSETTTEFLWLLHRSPSGALEPVDLLAGIVEVRGGRVPAWNMSLAEAIARIRSVGSR